MVPVNSRFSEVSYFISSLRGEERRGEERRGDEVVDNY